MPSIGKKQLNSQRDPLLGYTDKTTHQNITQITGLSDVIKVGADTRNDDGTYTVNFATPFVAGTDADISVVLNRQASDSSVSMMLINITKSGFQINRVNTLNGNQTINYIAVNGAYFNT